MTETVASLQGTISQIQNSIVRAAAQQLLYYAGGDPNALASVAPPAS